MLRIATTILIWLVLIGGVMTFVRSRAVVLPYSYDPVPPAASGAHSLELTATFPMVPDPFWLHSGADQPAPAVCVSLAGRELTRIAERVEAGQTLLLPDLPLAAGINELYIEAAPPLEEYQLPRALHLRVRRDGATLLEEVLWAEPGLKVAGTVRVSVAADTSGAAPASQAETAP